MRSKHILGTALIAAGVSTQAYGYIDPGVGSMVVQGILAGGAGILFFFRMFWARLKTKVRSAPQGSDQVERE